tara:strand:- start:161 stop:1009 length:849 start_codon:yes stop_codon:yes gene_type:complete
MTIQNTIKQASQILKKHNINTYNLDAEIILADLMEVGREFFILNNNEHVSEDIIKKFDFAIKRRIKNEPVAYITGRREFWSKDFLVNNATLIPRPETELLVHRVVNFFKNKKINILDIGTGSGCILLAILKELIFSRGIGIDICSKAIKTAELNSINLKLHLRAKFRTISLDEFNIGKYDLIVSNPPYIPTKELKNLNKDILNYEPMKALDGGVDGLDLIKKVIYKSNHLLKKEGLLALEIGNNQYLKVTEQLKINGYREISKECDYNDNVRCIISTKVRFF